MCVCICVLKNFFHSDIAIIKLNTSLDVLPTAFRCSLSKIAMIRPIRLNAKFTNMNLFGKQAIVSGFGRTETESDSNSFRSSLRYPVRKRYLKYTILEIEENVAEAVKQLHISHIKGHEEKGSGVCRGDSGSKIYIVLYN